MHQCLSTPRRFPADLRVWARVCTRAPVVPHRARACLSKTKARVVWGGSRCRSYLGRSAVQHLGCISHSPAPRLVRQSLAPSSCELSVPGVALPWLPGVWRAWLDGLAVASYVRQWVPWGRYIFGMPRAVRLPTCTAWQRAVRSSSFVLFPLHCCMLDAMHIQALREAWAEGHVGPLIVDLRKQVVAQRASSWPIFAQVELIHP